MKTSDQVGKRFTFKRIDLPPIAYILLAVHFIFFGIVGGYAFYAMNH